MDNKVEGKVLSVESSFMDEKIELKLEYLSELIDLTSTLHGVYSRELVQEVAVKRIVRLCNSIESDLGIKKETVAENIVVNLSVDTSDFERKLKELGEKTGEGAARIGKAFSDAAKRMSES